MKARTLAFLAVLALVGAPVLMAQTPATDPAAVPPADAMAPLAAPDATAPVVEGSVVSIGNTSLVITADDGTTRTFVVDTATTLPTTELATGSRVVVRYKPLDADRAQALGISAISATSATSTAPAGSGAPATEAPATLPEHGLVSPLAMGIGGLVVLAIIILMVTRRRPQDEAFHIG